MNSFKKILAFVLAAVMSVSMLAACGQTVEEPETTTAPDVTTVSEPTQAPDVTRVPDNTVAPDTTAPTTTPEVTTTPATTTEATTTSAATTSGDNFTVEEMSATMYATDAVNVRSGPSVDYDRIGGLQAGDVANVTGRASTGWYRVDYNGKVGYVSSAYLTTEAPSSVPDTGDDDEEIIIDDGDDGDITIPEGTVEYGDWASDNGIVKGSNGKFNPNTNITRQDIATMMYRYAQYKQADTTQSADLGKYTDAGQISDYALDSMEGAVAEGIISGRTQTTLVPRANLTRAEFATIISRYLA